ncbi:MAG TPA: LuxR C-terminal-related transcriptional regulator [Opitutaceae bacterium]|nr:LuxR C-terminal-related transcriptional regulator [Opitutaceae bacterium]HRJ46102.1 LuxR C-terminal-related transcriptional regulator [Opitutaceae bacterium]
MASKCPLSPAERRIVREVCAGRRNGEIARLLGKNLGTVKNQLSSAYRKLGVGSRVELILRQRRRPAG